MGLEDGCVGEVGVVWKREFLDARPGEVDVEEEEERAEAKDGALLRSVSNDSKAAVETYARRILYRIGQGD